mmetsp:Transcript_33048/g.36843  ORF Transcript_33048/g.36843 Transcript_33048/m.36843 type:complete len:95 (-) Transcript_33048:40-324(-)
MRSDISLESCMNVFENIQVLWTSNRSRYLSWRKPLNMHSWRRLVVFDEDDAFIETSIVIGDGVLWCGVVRGMGRRKCSLEMGWCRSCRSEYLSS